MSRKYDEHVNTRYVESPLLSEVLLPLHLVTWHLLGVVDLVAVNPFYWWKDAFRGEGTAYPVPKEGSDGDEFDGDPSPIAGAG